ncbi:MAG: histidinol-phosphate transaminase, partial [Lysobacter sp.]|nr:histidinol-phosphate transaminase [Lysobacter sp.]
ANAQAVFERLLAAGVVVRDMRASPRLENALRITVGSPEQNRRVVTVLQQEVPA